MALPPKAVRSLLDNTDTHNSPPDAVKSFLNDKLATM